MAKRLSGFSKFWLLVAAIGILSCDIMEIVPMSEDTIIVKKTIVEKYGKDSTYTYKVITGTIQTLTKNYLILVEDTTRYSPDVVKRVTLGNIRRQSGNLDKEIINNYWNKENILSSDTIFITSGESGIFIQKTGTIDTLTQDYLFMVTAEGNRTLYTGETVKRVGLDYTHTSHDSSIVGLYWNKERSLLLELFREYKYIGPAAIYLSNSLGDTTILILLLLGVLSFASYKVYDKLVIGASIRKYTSEKLRYEINAIKKDLGIISEELLEETAIPRKKKERKVFDIIDFLKFKLLRMLTEKQKEERRELWTERWDTYKEKKDRLRWRYSYIRVVLNLCLTFYAIMFTLGSLINIFPPLLVPEIFGKAAAIVSLFYLILFMLSLAFLLRLIQQRRIMTESYVKVKHGKKTKTA
jgi:hypothetical protein